MLYDKEFLRQSARSIVRYSLAQLIYIYTNHSKFNKLERLNITIAGKIARKTLINNNIIQVKSKFVYDNFAKLNPEKKEVIEALGIDTFINHYLLEDIKTIIESMESESTSAAIDNNVL